MLHSFSRKYAKFQEKVCKKRKFSFFHSPGINTTDHDYPGIDTADHDSLGTDTTKHDSSGIDTAYHHRPGDSTVHDSPGIDTAIIIL